MNLVFTLLFGLGIIGGIGYGAFLLGRKVFRKLYNQLSPYLGAFVLTKEQREALTLAKECMANNSVQVGEKVEDVENPGSYKNVMLVFKNDKFSIGYEYKKTNEIISLDDVNMIMYLDDSEKYVDANSLKSKPLMLLVEEYLKLSKEVSKAMDNDFLFEQMKSRKNSSRKSEN